MEAVITSTPAAAHKYFMHKASRVTSALGHILIKGKIEHTVTTGRIIDTRDRGRQREKILDSLCKWHGIELKTQLINITGDRNMWRCMTANVCRQGT